MNSNSVKGNAAEYYALYRLLSGGVPAWQTGGNNKRWDLIIQISPDRFVPASVKYAKTWLPILSARDEAPSKGIYLFIGPSKSTPGQLDVLLFSSKVVSAACRKYRKKSQHQKSFSSRPDFRNFYIDKSLYKAGIKSFERFLRKYSQEAD
jgi:hypothetical protein